MRVIQELTTPPEHNSLVTDNLSARLVSIVLLVTMALTVYRSTQTNTMRTFAGSGFAGLIDGTADQTMFRTPVSISLDSAGNLYIVDQKDAGYPGGRAIRKITQAVIVTTLSTNSILQIFQMAVSPSGRRWRGPIHHQSRPSG